MSIFGDYWITDRFRVPGHISLSFGNIELKELIVEKPHCSVDVVMSYACTGCLELPKEIFDSKEFSKEGISPYESNCTWDRDYISCNLEIGSSGSGSPPVTIIHI
ncbi:jg5069 [Pararge aegeria aegeria]|uniref:Jg5069 protein n=1 Tax=Pararge aegeria aegeria TaxID=348720 RepID=A0A8S4QTS3_9NEOP|nr:jg5069 [Pararge aegeria aegeria]